MGSHRVIFRDSFKNFTLLNEQNVVDFIEAFYVYDDPNSTWIIEHETGSVDFNGQHIYNPNTREHTISLSEKNIRRQHSSGRRDFGGNLKLPDIDVKMSAALVLAHEIQHANQAKSHKGNELFYGYLGGFNGKGIPRMNHYKGRACERDAREFVDVHLDEIFAYFDLPSPRRHRVLVPDAQDEVAEIADLLSECEKISMDDIRNELRSSNVLNPKNVQRVLQILQERGLKQEGSAVK